MYYLGLLASFAAVVVSESRTTAPSGALVVSKDGSGDYETVQAAVDALSSSSAEEQMIYIGAGTYSEQVYIPELSGPLSIFGNTTDTSSYINNVATITADGSQETVSIPLLVELSYSLTASVL